MAAKQEENPKLLRALLDFEKALVHANSFLKQNTDSFKQSLKILGEKASEIEELVSADKNAMQTMQRALEEKKLIQSYSQLSSAVAELKKSLLDFEEHSVKAEVFFESMRRERTYVFKTEQNSLAFIEQLFSLYAISSAAFRPAFIGLIDLNDVASRLQLQKKDKQQLMVEASKLQQLFDFLKQKKASKNFHLDSEEIKLLVKEPLQLKVEADNAKIKRLDRLAKEMDAVFE